MLFQHGLRREVAVCTARDGVSEISCIYDRARIIPSVQGRHLPHMCIVSPTKGNATPVLSVEAM